MKSRRDRPVEKQSIAAEDYGQVLYQLVQGAAAKTQQELTSQPSLQEYREKVDNATLGLLTSALWAVKHVARQTLSHPDQQDRCISSLVSAFYSHIEQATGGQFDRKELDDYLEQLHDIYDQAWNNLRDPGRTWWLARAMAKEILDTNEMPELAIVIMVGEVESILAMGARLTRQYFVK